MRRIAAIARKEFLHILRDPRSLAVAILMPLAMVLLYGSAIDMELRELPIGVLDLDRSDESRAFLRDLTAGGFNVVAERLPGRSAVEPGFRRNRFLAALVLPRGLGERIAAGEDGPVQVLVDGSDAATAAIAENYLVAAAALSDLHRAGPERRLPFSARTRILFNPELRSADFVVPGLTALILMMICALLTSIALTREKESGTLEQILTTPVLPSQVVIGKMIPYTILGALDASLVLATGRIVFGVPMHGSWWVLAVYSLLFILIALSVGLLISALASSLRVAMMAALLATMLPTMILSGFLFPIAGMPAPLRVLCRLLPATHFLVVIRGVLLKGRAWFPAETAILLGMGVILLAAAIRGFRRGLE